MLQRSIRNFRIITYAACPKRKQKLFLWKGCGNSERNDQNILNKNFLKISKKF